MKLSFYTPFVVFGIFILFFALEKLFPLRKTTAALLARLFINGGISALTFLIAMTVVHPAAQKALDWSSNQPFGLMHLFHWRGGAQFVGGFLLLDLSFYYWHWLNHKIPWLWRFHNVHHIDPDLDVSTGFRFHFGEVLFSTVFRVVQVSLIGVSLPTFVIYELVFQANTLFQHSNLCLPIRLERALNQLLVTPRMHGIHHSQLQRETDSNYGVVFPWWDRIHRTLGLNVAQAEIHIGVPGYASPEDNKFWRVLIMPFVKQRDYWRKPEVTIPRTETPATSKRSHLAE
ncbi:MAG: sterol desaturase family protein [Verrucomicrobiota bacterium]